MEAMLNAFWLLGSAGAATFMLYGAYLCCACRLAAPDPQRDHRSMTRLRSGWIGKAT